MVDGTWTGLCAEQQPPGRVGEEQRPGRSWRGPCRRRTAVAWPCVSPGRAPGPRCIERPSCPLPAQVGDPVGLGGQPHSPPVVQPRSPLRLAHLADRRGDRRAGHPDPAGQHVMGDSVAQVHQGGQQPVEEHQPVPGASSDRPPARPIGQPRVLARLPARPQLGDQLRQNLRGQSGHPAIGDRGGTGKSARRITTLLVLHTARSSRRANHARGRKRRPWCSPRGSAVLVPASCILRFATERRSAQRGWPRRPCRPL